MRKTAPWFVGIDPRPVLTVLKDLGYEATVITTPQEIDQAWERAKRAAIRRHGDSSSSSDDGITGDVAASIAAGFL